MAQLIPPWLRTSLKAAILLALVYLLVRSVDWDEAPALLLGARPLPLLAAATLLTIQTILSAVRWRLTAARLGIALPFWQAVREYYLSQMVNQSLPGGILGDAGRAIRARGPAGLLASGQAVLFERIAGQIGLLTILLLALGMNATLPNGLAWPRGVLVALWAAAGAGIVFTVFTISIGRPIFGKAIYRFRHSVVARPVLARQVALSLGTALCNVTAFALCATAIGAPLMPLAAATLVPMILFAMVLPLSISGWGLREGAAALLFPVAGLSATAGLASSVAFGVIFLGITLPGLFLLRHGPDFAADPSPRARP